MPRTFSVLRICSSEVSPGSSSLYTPNSRIRRDFQLAAEQEGLELFIPPLRLCGDNAAMIGAQGYYEYLSGVRAGSDLNAYASMELSRPYTREAGDRS